MTTEHLVEPNTETPIPGTGFAVQHGGDEEGYVHVEDDGTIRLRGPWDWTIRRAPAAPQYLIWSNWNGLWWRERGAGYTPDVLAAGRYTKEEADRHCRLPIWGEHTSVPKDVAILDVGLPEPQPDTAGEIRARIHRANRDAIEARRSAVR